MNGVFAAAAEVQRALDARAWPFCFIGGVAVLRWGEARATRDVDLALFTGFGGEGPAIAALLEDFRPRLPDAAQFAEASRMLLLASSHGVPIDVSLAALPFEEEMIARSTMHDFGEGIVVRTCSAEDLVVLKAFAGRPKDWADAEGVVTRQGPALDKARVLADAAQFADIRPGVGMMERLHALLSE